MRHRSERANAGELAQRLAEIGTGELWTQARASAWWNLHNPLTVVTDPNAFATALKDAERVFNHPTVSR